MNSDPANNKTLQWEVDRYLLADPSFNRDTFEQRMLEDLALAELVAASVTNLQAISSAAKAFSISDSTAKTQRPAEGSTSPNAYRWAMLVSAAAVLMAFSVWQLQSSPNDEQLSQIADNWVAIEGLSTADSLELIAAEEQLNENQEDLETNDQSDWMVEAAREFYLAKNEGAAG